MEALDVIEEMKKYNSADLCWDGSDDRWTLYLLEVFSSSPEDIEDWHGHGETPVEAYENAVN